MLKEITKAPLRILIHALGMPFNGGTIETRSLGGSESAAYYLGRELRRRGHHVELWTATEEDSRDENGVLYMAAGPVTERAPMGEFFTRFASTTPHDVLIIQRHPQAFHQKWAAKLCIWQLHDLARHRVAPIVNAGLWQLDAITVVSEFHRQQVIDVLGCQPSFVEVVPNGVDEALYHVEQDYIKHNDTLFEHWDNLTNQFLMLYQSRPERGLVHLVKPGGIMDRLRGTKAHLAVCAYDNTVPEIRQFYEQLNRWGEALPNVTNIGALPKAELAMLQRHATLLCYPTEFEEVSCITAMEAMHAGLPMLTSDVGAMMETCAGSGTLLFPLKDGKADEDAFVGKIQALLGPDSYMLTNLRENQLDAAVTKTWFEAANQLEHVIHRAFSRRGGTTAAAARHCVEHADIEFLSSSVLFDNLNLSKPDNIVSSTHDEVSRLYAYRYSATSYKDHYDKHQSEYYDDFEQKVIGEDVTNSMRFRGVLIHLGEQQERLAHRSMRVLDYGCAHGHYLIPLAKVMPASRFTGIDISDRAIAAAWKWSRRDEVHNIELRVGDQKLLDNLNDLCPFFKDPEEGERPDDGSAAHALNYTRDLFDVILLGEILEHVHAPHHLLKQATALLAPGGVIIGTTPFGRWEWLGHDKFKTGREHLWHFDEADLKELLAPFEHKLLSAPAGVDDAGDVIGSWVWAVRPVKGEPFGQLAYQRKRHRLAPRQTISACLIVKNGERTLRKCVESFVEAVDEVVILIDPSTTDRTRDIIDCLQNDHPWKPFKVLVGELPVLETGFAHARNLTLDAACGDWILWLDADEEMQQPFNLWRLAKASPIDAYGFPQVHYSCAPPTVLTTDHPCRFFRRTIGARFHGIVHEHPEVEQGKAIPYSLMRSDVQFLHNGYVDENTRRARFRRNLPLLLRDRQENPNRQLNQFLLLRDIAQGISFELEQTGGQVLEDHPKRAAEGVAIFEKLLDTPHLRLVIDSLQYYSQCVAVLQLGFEIKLGFGAKHDAAPVLAIQSEVTGRFHSRACYLKFLTKIGEEATRHYEDKYL